MIHAEGIIEPYSAGSRPSGKVKPKAIESMRELDYDLSRHSSKSLTEIPDVEHDVAVTMGCGDECHFARAKQREDWGIPAPKELSNEEFRKVRDLIETRVKELISRLEKY